MPTGIYPRTPEMVQKARACLAKGRMPKARKKAATTLRKIAQTPEWRLKVSLATKTALGRPEIRKKILEAAKKRGANFKGGNGQKPVELVTNLTPVMKSLGYVRELPIKTRGHTSNEVSLPSSYKVDFGHPENKIAVEIDGVCHRRNSAREKDRKKQAVLESLGWTVIRITH